MLRSEVGAFWQRVVAGEGVPGVLCPGCHSPTLEVRAEASRPHPVIDACRACQCIWFDAQEFESLPEPVEEIDTSAEIPQSARERLALMRVDAIAREAEKVGVEPQHLDHWWHMLPPLLGMPLEAATSSIGRYPVVTWSLAAITFLVSALAFRDLSEIALRFGFVPNDPYRLSGLTALTCFVLHGGWLHLIGNLYYFVIFGDNVEDRLGHVPYLLLLLLATVAGAIGYAALDPYSDVPLIGASGGVSGILAYYACAFPRARLGIFVWRMHRHGFVWVPVGVGIVFWVLIQLYGAWQQAEGVTNVSAVSHLAGAAVGFAAFLAGWLWRRIFD